MPARPSTVAHLLGRIVPRCENVKGDTGSAPSNNTEAIPERVAFARGPGSTDGRAPRHRGRVWSKHGLQIRPHHSFNPADPRVFHELVYGEFSDSLTIGSKRLDSDINSDFVAVLEAVSNCFFGRVDFDRHPIDVNRLDSGFKGARWEPEDSDGHTVHLGDLSVTLKRNIDVVRHLCCQLIVCESGDQANHCSRDAKTDLYPIGIRESRSVCETIQTPPNRDDLAGIPKSIQGARVNSQAQGAGGPKHSSVLAKGFPSEREICRNLRHTDGYNARILYTMSELFIHTLTRFPTLPPVAAIVIRGFDKGSITITSSASDI